MDETKLAILEKTGSADVQDLVREVRRLRTVRWGVWCIPIPHVLHLHPPTSTRAPEREGDRLTAGWLKDPAFGSGPHGGRVEVESKCCAETIARVAQQGWYSYEPREIVD